MYDRRSLTPSLGKSPEAWICTVESADSETTLRLALFAFVSTGAKSVKHESARWTWRLYFLASGAKSVKRGSAR